jgi:putative tryptophan/tyrosine transport system substrate-binding protein
VRRRSFLGAIAAMLLPVRLARAQKYAQRILAGTNPSDPPVEGTDKLSFVVNLKTARQIGLTIPESVLARADRIIE